MNEPFDSITVEAYGTPGSTHIDFNFEDWTTFALTSSIMRPCEASFELGDQTGWERLTELISLGSEFRVFVDDRLRLTGRIEQLNSVSDARQSATQRFTVRTKLSDAVFSAAPQNVRLSGRTVREFLLALYKDIGLTEANFDFRGDVSRDVMTGRITKGPDAHSRRRGVDGRLLADPPAGFEAVEETEENSKVQPPESIYEAADRVLRRHGMLHWDGPDGKIVVAPPNDMQDPIAFLRSIRGEDGGAGQYNNVQSLERDQDVSEAPTEMGVFGMGGKAGFARASVSAVIRNQALIDRGFTRRAAVLDEGLTNQAIAKHRACREFVTRSRGLDRITAIVDGLSYRDDGDRVPWSPDTTVEVFDDTLGGVLGVYYAEEIQMQRDAGAGDVARISLVRQGVWQL